MVQLTADLGGTNESAKFTKGFYPLPLKGSLQGQAILERRVLHYPDVMGGVDVPERLRRVGQALGNFSVLFAPLLWEGRGVGAIVVNRMPAVPFTDKEIALLKTFADQAVIAIQNARLFNETQEALETQTATAEVLRVVNRSMDDPQPVFESICTSLQALLPGAELVISAKGDDGMVHWKAGSGRRIDDMRSLFPRPAPTKMMLTGAATHHPDLLHGEGVPESLREAARKLGGNASMLSAAMHSGDMVFGAILALRLDMRPFSDKEGRVLKTFADQAGIAIQNARLFNETKEALERQSASAEVLQAISRLKDDLTPVVGTILDCCQRLIPDLDVIQVERIADGMVSLMDLRIRPHALGAQAERAGHAIPQPVPVSAGRRSARSGAA